MELLNITERSFEELQKVAGVVSALKTYGSNLAGRSKDINRFKSLKAGYQNRAIPYQNVNREAANSFLLNNSDVSKDVMDRASSKINNLNYLSDKAQSNIDTLKNNVLGARLVTGMGVAGAGAGLYMGTRSSNQKQANSSDPIKLPLGPNGVVFGKGYTRPNVLDTQSNAPNDAGDGRAQVPVPKSILRT